MKVETNRGIENLNVRRCPKCLKLVPPTQIFGHGKKELCSSCFTEENSNHCLTCIFKGASTCFACQFFKEGIQKIRNR